jgi:hypothetical protein
MKLSIITLILSSLIAYSLNAAVQQIDNATTIVRYDEAAHTFSLIERVSGETYLHDGKLDGESLKVSSGPVNDAVFGGGKHLVIAQSDGSTVSIELYDSIPFVLIRKKMRNNGATITDFKSLVPVRFTLDLGKTPAELRTMGTAGLTPPDGHSGSYLFLTLADPATRRGVVAGWLTEDRASGVLFSTVKDGRVEFKAQIDYGHLRIPPGSSEDLETLAIGLFNDARIGEELYADAIKKQYNINLRPEQAGYCTWYSEIGGLTDKTGGGGSSNERDLARLTAFAAQKLAPFGFSFVQIDDGWQDGKFYNGPRRGFTRAAPTGPYPHGMAPVADMIKSNGLTAGLWFMPFARNHQDPEYASRQQWFMKRLDGKPYETFWGGTSLDLTRPEVQAYLIDLARTIHGWGYDYFKLEGLWTGSVTEQMYVNDGYKDDNIGNYQPFSNPRTTSIEALRDGLKLLRKGAGPDVFFSGCCASQNMRSLAGAIGLVDSMRIGPDNGFEWENYRKEVMHFEGGEMITGPIRANHLYFMNGRVWWNDPDPSYVRPAVKLNHAQLLSSWIALAGMFNLNSDWLPGLPPERLDILKRCLPSYRAVARPVDYFESIMPSIWLTSQTDRPVRRDVLGLYNWESTNRIVCYDTARSGLESAKTYHSFDFWGKAALPDFTNSFSFEVPAESCKVIAVRAAEDHPVLVSTSRHVTQGMVDVIEENWDSASSTLSGTSKVVGKDPYELRIAGLNDGGRWKLVSASIPTGQKAASADIKSETSINGEENWIRLLITSETTRAIDWSVKFADEYPIEKSLRAHSNARSTPE